MSFQFCRKVAKKLVSREEKDNKISAVNRSEKILRFTRHYRNIVWLF